MARKHKKTVTIKTYSPTELFQIEKPRYNSYQMGAGVYEDKCGKHRKRARVRAEERRLIRDWRE